ncbi:MAG: hypothetical protein AAFY28_12535 [Actinomycetota bacterium]
MGDYITDDALDALARDLLPPSPRSISWERAHRERLIEHIAGSTNGTASTRAVDGAASVVSITETRSKPPRRSRTRLVTAGVAAIAMLLLVAGLVVAQRSTPSDPVQPVLNDPDQIGETVTVPAPSTIAVPTTPSPADEAAVDSLAGIELDEREQTHFATDQPGSAPAGFAAAVEEARSFHQLDMGDSCDEGVEFDASVLDDPSVRPAVAPVAGTTVDGSCVVVGWAYNDPMLLEGLDFELPTDGGYTLQPIFDGDGQLIRFFGRGPLSIAEAAERLPPLTAEGVPASDRQGAGAQLLTVSGGSTLHFSLLGDEDDPTRSLCLDRNTPDGGFSSGCVELRRGLGLLHSAFAVDGGTVVSLVVDRSVELTTDDGDCQAFDVLHVGAVSLYSCFVERPAHGIDFTIDTPERRWRLGVPVVHPGMSVEGSQQLIDQTLAAPEVVVAVDERIEVFPNQPWQLKVRTLVTPNGTGICIESLGTMQSCQVTLGGFMLPEIFGYGGAPTPSVVVGSSDEFESIQAELADGQVVTADAVGAGGPFFAAFAFSASNPPISVRAQTPFGTIDLDLAAYVGGDADAFVEGADF